jgi:hypothetical protein
MYFMQQSVASSHGRCCSQNPENNVSTFQKWKTKFPLSKNGKLVPMFPLSKNGKLCFHFPKTVNYVLWLAQNRQPDS